MKNTDKSSPTFYVGYEYKNKQGLDVTVTEYNGRKDIRVKFTMDGVEKSTTGSYIKRGLPLHPTFGKPFVGQQFPCHDGDVVEVIEIHSLERILVKWLSDNTESYKTISSLRKGHNRHPSKNVPKIGAEYGTKNYGKVKVLEFRNATSVLVSFEDGAEVVVSVSALTRGIVAHPTKSVRIGKEYTTKSGWKGVVVEYKDAHNVLVQWQDGSKTWHAASHILTGAIKPLTQPSLENVGYFGIGRFVPYTHKHGKKAPLKIHGYWVRMISRCYNPSELSKPKGLSYEDKYVAENWHDFQNFAEWALRQPNWDEESFELDKDLLHSGNKLYEESACCFLPPEINAFLQEKNSGEYLRGVHRIAPKTKNSKEGYISRCHADGERKYLGFYPTPELAFAAYKDFKENHAKVLAERWKDKITKEAYLALCNFQVPVSF